MNDFGVMPQYRTAATAGLLQDPQAPHTLGYNLNKLLRGLAEPAPEPSRTKRAVPAPGSRRIGHGAGAGWARVRIFRTKL